MAATSLVGCAGSSEQATEVTELTIYSGRSEEFIAPFFAQFEDESGINLNVRYGDSAELAAQILEEGSNSPADLFLAQDAGSLGAIALAELFLSLPDGVGSNIPAQFIESERKWIGVTGRARVFAYNPETVGKIPTAIEDMTDSAYRGRLGIVPTNASFQAFITALIENKGEAFTEKWLRDLKSNDVRIYPKNSAIVEAIDKNEISIGLTNHYYVWEIEEALGRPINVKNGFFSPGDLGNLINVSGAGVLLSSKKYSAAQDLINFLTSTTVQSDFVTKTNEYSLIPGSPSPADLPGLDAIGAPTVDLGTLRNIQRTQDLLVKVGLL